MEHRPEHHILIPWKHGKEIPWGMLTGLTGGPEQTPQGSARPSTRS